MSGKALVRIWAQIGDNALLYELGSGEVASHAELAAKLHEVADAYADMDPRTLPLLGSEA